MDDNVKHDEEEVVRTLRSREVKPSSFRFLWLMEVFIFLILWGVCIMTILNLNETQRSSLAWVVDLFQSHDSELDPEKGKAVTDIYADDTFSFVLREKEGSIPVPVDDFWQEFEAGRALLVDAQKDEKHASTG